MGYKLLSRGEERSEVTPEAPELVIMSLEQPEDLQGVAGSEVELESEDVVKPNVL
jgi:hypothetical protein